VGPDGDGRRDRPRGGVLADPASDYITGTILHVDGGLFLPWWSKRGTGEL